MTDRPATDDLESWFDRMNSEFREAARWWNPRSERGFRSAPAIDVLDAGDRYEVTADLPGFDPAEIDVRFADGVVTIEAERTEIEAEMDDVDGESGEDGTDGESRAGDTDGEWVEDDTGESGQYLRRERHHRSLTRRIRLPDPVETGEITASLDRGVLTLMLPKTESAREGTRIEVT